MPDQTRNLNSVTDFAGTLDSNDRLIMTDNKASLKALTTAILGKAMIEGYTGSSLAGSSQSVKAAIDSLNNNTYLLNGANKLPNNTNLNSVVTPGVYNIQFTVDAQTMTNLPVVTAGIVIVEKSGYASNNYKRQTFYEFNNINRHIRCTNDNGNTWSTWEQAPTRAEITALNSKSLSNSYKCIQKNTTSSAGSVRITYSGETGSRYVGFLFILQNNGTHAVYSVGYKQGVSKNISKIFGTDSDVSIDDNGTITVSLQSWSMCSFFGVETNGLFS